MTYHTQRSIIQSPTSAALSDYSILLYLPFCRTLFSFPLLQPSALSPHAPAPNFLFLVLCRLSFRANQNEQNSWGHWKVAGTHVSWHIFTLVWCPLSLRWHVNNLEKRTTEWFQYTSHDWNRKVFLFFFLHMSTLVRIPALDSRYDFFPPPSSEWVEALMENTIVAFQRLYGTIRGALSVWADAVCCSLCRFVFFFVFFLPLPPFPEKDKWQNHVRLAMQRG